MQEEHRLLTPQRQRSLPWASRRLMPPATRFGPDKDGFEIFVTKHAVEVLRSGTLQRKPLEAFGLLMGRAHMDQAGAYTVVTGVVYATKLSATAGHVKLTGPQMEELRKEARTRYPAEDQVGWTHSHPGVFPYSDVDREEQRTWQEPHHVGILTFMSNRPGEPWAAGYRGPDSVPLRLTSDVEVKEGATFTNNLQQHDKSNPFDPDGLQLPRVLGVRKRAGAQAEIRSKRAGIILRILIWASTILVVALLVANLVVSLSIHSALTDLGQTIFTPSAFSSAPSLTWSCSPVDHARDMTVTCDALATSQVTNWIWYYGDGGTASGQHVTHTYRSAGTYQVHLEIITLYSTLNAGAHYVRVAPRGCLHSPNCIDPPIR